MVRALLVIPFLLLPVAAGADAGQQQVRDQLVWDFAEFVHHFRGRNWEGVCRFVSERTKAGFGGETGCAGVRQVYADNEACWKEMVFALRQGCKRAGRGSNVSCIAPPQFGADKVVYSGARAAFSYREEPGRWMVDFLICGGD